MIYRNVLMTTLTLALIVAGCTKAPEEANAQQTATAELPADVRSVESLAGTDPAAPAPGAVTEADVAVVRESTLTANGEFISPAHSQVSPKIPGRVAQIHVDEGARVERGQPLLTLETDYLRLDVDRAMAQLAQANAALGEAERDLARKTELRGKGSVPQATFDRSRAAFDQAQAARAGAQTGVSLARQRLADAVIRSPLSGVVADRSTDVGEYLADGGVAFVVIQTAPLRLRFRVPEKYLGRIRTGQAVVAHVDPYPGEEFAGTIETVGGVIDPQTRTLFAEARFPNRDGRLRPGLFARVEAQLQ